MVGVGYLAATLCPGVVVAQDQPVNATLAGHWNGFDGLYTDVWTHGEFAYIGHWGPGIHIVDISRPSEPVALDYELPPPNTGALAFDLKVVDDLLFIGLEGDPAAAVHIVDVRDPMNPVHVVDVSIEGHNHVHNLFYDEGFLYLAGAQLVIVDLTGLDPDEPPATTIDEPLWILEDLIVHDITVRDGRLYACAWSDLNIYDVTNVGSQPPTFLGEAAGNAIHSAWPTDDGGYVVTASETSGGGIGVYRITDKGNGIEITLNRVYCSWYQAGLQVFDIDPITGLLSFVASYDTFGGPVSGFDGAWGVNPFLGTQRVVVSDLSNGLFIINTCPADLDGGGTVDVDDLIAIIAGWGCSGDACEADVNDDGVVDVDDLIIVLLKWGPCE
jgi:hypothetical protein